jgi:hypothetical protein
MPCYNTAKMYHVQWYGSHRSFLQTLYIAPSMVVTGVWSSIFTGHHGGHWSLLQTLPHAIHSGHGSVMQSLLPHVIAVTGFSCTSCTYVMAVTSVWRRPINLSTATSVTTQCLYMFLCMYLSAGFMQSLQVYVQCHLWETATLVII